MIEVQLSEYCKFIRCRSPICQGKNCFCYLCGDELDEKGHYDHYVNRDPYGEECLTMVKNSKENKQHEEKKEKGAINNVKECKFCNKKK